MQLKSMLSLVITLAISVILVGSVLAPVISDATQSFNKVEKEQANVNNYMSAVDAFTFEQDNSNYTVTLDGETLAYNSGDVLMVSDKVIITAAVIASSVTTNPTMAIWAEGYSSATISPLVNDLSVTLADGVITIVYGADSTTLTFNATFAYVYDEDGDYACINNASYVTSIYANAGDDITLFKMGGWWTTTYEAVQVTATAGELTADTQTFGSTDTTGTDATITVTFTAQDYDCLLLESIDPTSTLVAIAPASYTAYEDSAYGNLLGATLVMVLVGLVVMAVALVTKKD